MSIIFLLFFLSFVFFPYRSAKSDTAKRSTIFRNNKRDCTCRGKKIMVQYTYIGMYMRGMRLF